MLQVRVRAHAHAHAHGHAQSCPTLCNPVEYSLPGSSVLGIFQARILEWVSISSSRVSPGIDPTSLSSPALAGGFFITSATWEVQEARECEGSSFFLRIILFIYLWLCWVFVAAQAFSSCGKQGLLSSCSVAGFSLHGFSC